MDAVCGVLAQKISSGPQMGALVLEPPPFGGSPTPQSRATNSALAHKWADGLYNPCRLGGPQLTFHNGGEI